MKITNKLNSRFIKHSSTFLFLVSASFLMNTVEARPSGSSCPAGHTISKTFSSGSSWEMCWQIRDQEGLVFSDVKYKPVGRTARRILGEASLSQIQTEYDDGSAGQFLVTDYGLGGNNLQTLNNTMCEGGQLHQNAGRDVVCEVSEAAGYIYRYNRQQRNGDKLTVFSVSAVEAREYIIRWTFLENGTIEPAVGITGQFNKTTTDENSGWKVTAQDKISSSFVDHYFWRLDFDIADDSSNDIIEQIKSVPSSTRLTKTKQTQTISRELAASLIPAEKKFWRVRDNSVTNNSGKPISYEMVLLNYGQQNKGNSASPWLKNDLYITQYNACERFAADNPNNNCGTNVSEFVNAQNTNAKDLVVWYRLTHHTLPRDEDFNSAVPQWSTFLMLPRDWTSTNRL
jgi:primary-amine oxidase